MFKSFTEKLRSCMLWPKKENERGGIEVGCRCTIHPRFAQIKIGLNLYVPFWERDKIYGSPALVCVRSGGRGGGGGVCPGVASAPQTHHAH